MTAVYNDIKIYSYIKLQCMRFVQLMGSTYWNA